MSRDILVAMERNTSSEEALKFALQEYPESTIIVLHVLASGDPLDLFSRPEPSDYLVPDCEYDLNDELMPDQGRFEREQRKRAEQVFTQACHIAEEHGKEIELAVESGKTSRQIAEYTEHHAIDQIIIGDREFSGLSRALFGNIAASIGRRTSIPVTIIC